MQPTGIASAAAQFSLTQILINLLLMLEITFLKFLRLVSWKNKWKNYRTLHLSIIHLFRLSQITNRKYSNVHNSCTALGSYLTDRTGNPDLLFHVCSEVKVINNIKLKIIVIAAVTILRNHSLNPVFSFSFQMKFY